MEKETEILASEAIRLSDELIGDLRWRITKHLFAIFGYVLLDIRNFRGEPNLLTIVCSVVCGIGIGAEVAKIIIIAKHLFLVKGVNKTCKAIQKMEEGGQE